jgi:hypothetical protein
MQNGQKRPSRQRDSRIPARPHPGSTGRKRCSTSPNAATLFSVDVTESEVAWLRAQHGFALAGVTARHAAAQNVLPGYAQLLAILPIGEASDG